MGNPQSLIRRVLAPRFQASRWDAISFLCLPGVETPGYFHLSLRDIRGKGQDYQEQFPVGRRVRVKTPFLEQFRRDWMYHQPIFADQLDCSRKIDTVKIVASTTVATFFANCRIFPVHGAKRV
jgi:hypothetical protein